MLVPATSTPEGTSEGAPDGPPAGVEEAAGTDTIASPAAADRTEWRVGPTPRRLLAVGVVLASIYAGVTLLPESEESADPTGDALDAGVGGGPVQPVEGRRSPRRSDLSGLWLEVGDDARAGALLAFDPDDVFRWDDDGRIGGDPAVRGTWELDGDTIHLVSEGSTGCEDGVSWSWQVEYPRNGRLEIVHAGEAEEDGCVLEPGSRGELARLAPDPVLVAQPGAPEAEGTHPLTAADLRGVWAHLDPDDRIGPLVAFDAEGTYATDDRGTLGDDPGGRGSWELDGEFLTFTSAGASACREGEVWAWEVGLAQPGQLDIVIAQQGDPGRCPTAEPGTQLALLQVSPHTPASPRHLVTDESSHELTIAWNGDGCDHDVPATLPAGTHTVTTENGHAERVLGLMVQPFEPGSGHEDLLAWLGPERPATMDFTDAPFLQEGGQRIRVGAGTRSIDDVTLTAGEYALVCWLRGPPTIDAWPLDAFTVTDDVDASTHTERDPETAEALATAHAYMEARDAFDPIKARELLADDVIIEDSFHLHLDELGPAFKSMQVGDFRMSPFECEVASPTEAAGPEPDGAVEVVCDYTLTSRMQRSVGYGPIDATFTLTVVNGSITRSDNGFPYDEFHPNAWSPFARYLHERRVFPFVMRHHGGTVYPELTQQALELMALVYEEYEVWTEEQRAEVAD